jgi:hypothetical protein
MKLEDAAEMALVGKPRGRRDVRERLLRVSQCVAGGANSQLVKVFANRLTETAPELPGQVNRMHVNGRRDLEDRQGPGEMRPEKIDTRREPARLPAFCDAPGSRDAADELPDSAVDHFGSQSFFRVQAVESRGKAREISLEEPRFVVRMGRQEIGRAIEPFGLNLDEKKHGTFAADPIAVGDRWMKSDRKRTVFELPTLDLFEVGAAGNQAEVGGGVAVSRQATLRVVDHLGDDGRRKLLLSANRAEILADTKKRAHESYLTFVSRVRRTLRRRLFSADIAPTSADRHECKDERPMEKDNLRRETFASAAHSDRRISIHKSE